MNTSRAFVSGVFGAAVMSLIFSLGRALGVPVNLAEMIGSMITGNTAGWTWIIGFVIHLAVGGVMGLIYGEIFAHTLARPSVGLGAVLGAFHAVIAGLLLAVVPRIHPGMPEAYPAPGIFLVDWGAWAVVFFVGAHLVFGMIMGGAYEPRPVPLANQRMGRAHPRP